MLVDNLGYCGCFRAKARSERMTQSSLDVSNASHLSCVGHAAMIAGASAECAMMTSMRMANYSSSSWNTGRQIVR
jgi:hypothetical protein